MQELGADVHDRAGNKNDWYGWTTADNGRTGWASPLEAVGGTNYGGFSGVPSCNGAHGQPPNRAGVWPDVWRAGAAPAPAPPSAPAPVSSPDRCGPQKPFSLRISTEVALGSKGAADVIGKGKKPGKDRAAAVAAATKSKTSDIETIGTVQNCVHRAGENVYGRTFLRLDDSKIAAPAVAWNVNTRLSS